jgi:chromosome segregation ATPase
MMLKYGLDEGKEYTEVNTLLEANNKIPSWENGGEEANEVSTALRKLRQDYDEIRRKALDKDMQLEQMNADIKKAKEEKKRVSRDHGGASDDIEMCEQKLKHLWRTHNFMKMENLSFKYMCDRMKRDLISFTLTINDLTISLRSKTSICDDETRKQIQARERKLQSRFRLQILMESLTRDQKKRQERITSLNQSIKNKEEAI